MNTTDLRIFMTIAKLGSINKTAQALNYAQSNITSRLNKFEQQIQTNLFIRSKTGVILTEKGHILLPLAEKIIALTETFAHEAQSDMHTQGHLHISTSDNNKKLPIIFSKFINNYPDIELTVSSCSNETGLDDISHYKTDGLFTSHHHTPKEFKAIEIFKDELVLMTPPQTNDIQQIIEQPIIHYHDGSDFQSNINDWLRNQKMSFSRAMTLNSLNAAIGLVNAGVGYSYAPYTYIEQERKKGLINTIAIDSPYKQLNTRFIYRNMDHLSPSMDAFVKTIEEIRSSFTK